MFIFDGPFGRILHTGDFRWDRDSIFEETKAEVGELLTDIDAIVVDNTSSTPKHTYSSRQECMQLLNPVLDIYPADAVFKVGVESVGKEELLEAMAKRLRTKVWVKQARYRLLAKHAVALDMGFFTTKPDEARVHAVGRKAVREAGVAKWDSGPGFVVGIDCSPFIQAERGQKQTSKLLSLKPHLLPFSLKSQSDVSRLRTKTKQGKLCKLLPKRLVIPYSLHSSFHETANFVRYFRPGEVHAFVYFSGSAAKSIAALNRKFCAPNLPRRRQLKEACSRLKDKRGSMITRKKARKHIQGTIISGGGKAVARVKRIECSGDFEQIGYADPNKDKGLSSGGQKRKRTREVETTLVQRAITWLRRVDNNHMVAKIEELFGTSQEL